MDIIKLLKAYVNKEQLNMDINNNDIKLLLEQSLQTLLYPVTQNKEYKKYYIGWVLKQEQFKNVENIITNIFNDNNINHFYFKGSVLCNYYQDLSVRTRGDIDLYIDINDLDKARTLLLNNNFIEDKEGSTLHNIVFIYNEIEIELHYKLFDDSHPINLINYFNEPFKLCNLINNNLYQLNDNAHFIYCLAHFAHHLRQGAGIRYMLDFYYMFKKTNINLNELRNDLNKLYLLKLYNNILNALYYIFNEKFDEFKEEDIKYFINYMLISGIHGFGDNNKDSISQAVAHVSKKRYFIAKVFLTNKEYRKAKYPKLGSKAILYPICLLKHLLYLITHNFKSLLKFLFGKNKKKDLYKKLGI